MNIYFAAMCKNGGEDPCRAECNGVHYVQYHSGEPVYMKGGYQYFYMTHPTVEDRPKEFAKFARFSESVAAPLFPRVITLYRADGE